MAFDSLNFTNDSQPEFVKTLRKRVKESLKDANKTRFGGAGMVFKTIFMVILYFLPYALSYTGLITSNWIFLLLWSIMGVGMSGIGLAVMHDANHGAFSKNQKVNKWVGYLLNLVGGNATNWKIQHNMLHHSFTNVEHFDEDITTVPILRFSPHSKLMGIHKFQFIYAWLFYSLMTISWCTSKDFFQMIRFHRSGLLKSQGKSFPKLYTSMVAWKVLYYVYALILPLIFAPVAWWMVLISFIVMHLIAGFILSAIFQPAHVMPSSEFPLPTETGYIENDWAIHQLHTTSNFAPKARFFTWFVGGLNYQIEHHLFPNISHVHYRRISKVVRETAHEYGIPYYSQKTFVHALYYHGKMLYMLGQPKYATQKVKA